jgi:iron complex outermembrane receptor protein
MLIGAVAAPANAQEVPPEQAAEGGVGEIIVTAQRRSESQQKVPVSVASANAEELASLNITTAEDLSKIAPSLRVTPEVGSVTVFLRGVGSTITAIGNEASVAVYVDGVYYSRLTPALTRLNSIERVEVLRGPQGTLFGRNSSGGLVNFITKTPTPGQEFEGKVQVGYGNFDTVDGSAYIASSLGNSVAFDLSGVYHKQSEGWGDNLATGRENYTDESYALRAKLAVDLGPDTRAILTYEHTYNDSDQSNPSHFQNGLQGTFNPAPGQGTLPLIGIYDAQVNDLNFSRTRYNGGSVRLEHDLGFAKIINTAAYHDTKQRYLFDGDSGPSPLLSISLPSTSKEFLNEFQIVSGASSSFDWQAGIFYMDQKQEYTPARISGALIGLGTGGGEALLYSSFSGVKALSGYAQGRVTLVENLKLTLGARYSHDKVRGRGSQTILFPGGILFPIPGTAQTDARTINQWSYRAGLDYQFTDDIMAYASISRGYKGATYNMIPFSATPARPEVLEAYEIGLKTQLADNMIRFNAAVFRYDISNPQVITTPAAGVALTSNADSARITGADVEVVFAPTSNFRLNASATYLDAEYTRYTNAGFTNPNPAFPFGNLPTVPGDASGNRLVRAPEWSGNVGAKYTIDTANGGAIDLNADLSFNSSIFFEPDNRLRQGGYALIGGQIAYTFPNQLMSVRIWGENLTGKEYYVTGNAVSGGQGDIGAPGAPRTFGITASVEF